MRQPSGGLGSRAQTVDRPEHRRERLATRGSLAIHAGQVTVARARLATLPPYARRARTYAKFGEHRAGASRGARDSPRASLCLFRANSTQPHLSPRRRQRHAQVQNVSIREAAPGFYPRDKIGS